MSKNFRHNGIGTKLIMKGIKYLKANWTSPNMGYMQYTKKLNRKYIIDRYIKIDNNIVEGI